MWDSIYIEKGNTRGVMGDVGSLPFIYIYGNLPQYVPINLIPHYKLFSVSGEERMFVWWGTCVPLATYTCRCINIIGRNLPCIPCKRWSFNVLEGFSFCS